MYRVATPDGLHVALVDVLTPGGAAKKAVESGQLYPGRLVVEDEAGERSVWLVSETRLVYAREVKDG